MVIASICLAKEHVKRLIAYVVKLVKESFLYVIIAKKEVIAGIGILVNPFQTNRLLASEKLLYLIYNCLLYTSPSPRDRQKSRMPSSA